MAETLLKSKRSELGVRSQTWLRSETRGQELGVQVAVVVAAAALWSMSIEQLSQIPQIHLNKDPAAIPEPIKWYTGTTSRTYRSWPISLAGAYCKNFCQHGYPLPPPILEGKCLLCSVLYFERIVVGACCQKQRIPGSGYPVDRGA